MKGTGDLGLGATGAAGAGGNASGGGGNGGDGGSGAYSCGAPGGAFPLLEVGQFKPNDDSPFASLQAVAAAANRTVLAGFSGQGFKTSGDCDVAADTFFVLELDELGSINTPVTVGTGPDKQPVISLAKDDMGLVVGTSTAARLTVQRFDDQLKLGSVLLSCGGDGAPPPPITQGRVVSNGKRVAAVAELAPNASYTCKVLGVDCQIESAPTPGGSLLVWAPSMVEPCDQLKVLAATGAQEGLNSPRLSLGPELSPGVGAELLLTARTGTMPDNFLMQQASGALTDTFDFGSFSPIGPAAGVVLPATQSTAGNGLLAGVVKSSTTNQDAAFLSLVDEFTPITGPTQLVAAPAGGTSTRITALDAKDNLVLVVGQLDGDGVAAFVPSALPAACTFEQRCGFWRLFDDQLQSQGTEATAVALTPPGVSPTAGALAPGFASQPLEVVWAGHYTTAFDLGRGTGLADPGGPGHVFVARQPTPSSTP